MPTDIIRAKIMSFVQDSDQKDPSVKYFIHRVESITYFIRNYFPIKGAKQSFGSTGARNGPEGEKQRGNQAKICRSGLFGSRFVCRHLNFGPNAQLATGFSGTGADSRPGIWRHHSTFIRYTYMFF